MMILLLALTISIFTGIALVEKRICKTIYREEDLTIVRQDPSAQIKNVLNKNLISSYILCAIFAILIPLVMSGTIMDIIFLLIVTLVTILFFWQSYRQKDTYYLMNKEQVRLIKNGEQLWQISWKEISLAHRFIKIRTSHYGELVFNLHLKNGQVLKYIPQEIEPYLQEHGVEILRK